MPKFDYRVITIPWLYDSPTFEVVTTAALDTEGANKWELVLIIVNPNLTATAVFKK